MKILAQRLAAAALAAAVGLTASPLARAQKEKKAGAAPSPATAGGVNIPVTYYKLPNGLRVVLSPDHSSPTVTVGVYYKIGFRVEPRDRTGFAHLFEHMMFQGSQNLGKMEFIQLIQKNGGILNGSTRFDFTNYFEVVPAHKLETALWAEADRMKGLDITEANLKNQQGVVGNEVKVNVINAPYGGFPWLDMPQLANENYYNAHNFYGDLKDIESATLPEVIQFFKTYYAPNNAALAVVGDFEEAEARAWIEKYFAGIPASQLPPEPDLSEPRQEKEKRKTKTDALAKRPALAFAYHMPDRNTPEYYAMILLDQILLQGDDALLRQELVKRRAYTDSVNGGTNLLGNPFNYQGPMEWMVYLFHDQKTSPDQIMEAVDAVMAQVREKPLEQKVIDRAIVKGRSAFYDILGQLNGFGRADLLASFALFDDDPSRINRLESEFRKVTPQIVMGAAQKYLRTTNRSVLIIEPKSGQ
ncbi:MAG: insulinase family protein [Acidobacteria bacterium]|nr:insulinase family protein [Acidobacteriota bacterium]MCA1642360.1 insulinase family protein [Acidobacteriota bacterium]